MTVYVIELAPGVEVEADVDVGGSPDPRSGLFQYSNAVHELPEPTRGAAIGGAIDGHEAARALDLMGSTDEVVIESVTLRGEVATEALRAAMHVAVLRAAGARADVVRDGASWRVARDVP